MSAAATGDRSRHLSCAALREHLDSRLPMLIPIEGGKRTLYWHLEGGVFRPALRIPVDPGVRAPRLATHDLRAVCVLDGTRRYLHVYTEQPAVLREFHLICCEIADLIQEDDSDPARAVAGTVAAWRRLLARRQRMPVHEEVGLFGELLTLFTLGRATGWGAAVGAWQNPGCKDHDFTATGFDAEVKTAAAASARVHMIHGLGQLTPHTAERPLWFVSHLLDESDTGRSVLGLTAALRTVIRTEAPHVLDDFDARLGLRVGGRYELPRERRWAPHGGPLTVRVDENFPRLTEAALYPLPETAASRITRVDYLIDVSDLAGGQAPDGLAAAVDLRRALPPDPTAELAGDTTGAPSASASAAEEEEWR